MTAVAGIEKGGKVGLVKEMLNAMSHRGSAWMEISQTE